MSKLTVSKLEKSIKEICNIDFSNTSLEGQTSLFLTNISNFAFIPISIIENVKITVNGIKEDLESLSPIVDRPPNGIDRNFFKHYMDNIHERAQTLKEKNLNFDEKQLKMIYQIEFLSKLTYDEEKILKQEELDQQKELSSLKDQEDKYIKEKKEFLKSLKFLERLLAIFVDRKPEISKNINEAHKALVEKKKENSKTNLHIVEFNRKTKDLRSFLQQISIILGEMKVEIAKICAVCDELRFANINFFDIKKKNSIEKNIDLLKMSSDKLLNL